MLVTAVFEVCVHIFKLKVKLKTIIKCVVIILKRVETHKAISIEHQQRIETPSRNRIKKAFRYGFITILY